MKTILFSSLIFISTLGYANTNSQFETLDDYLSAPLSLNTDDYKTNESKNNESKLIENLLSGLDFSISKAVIANSKNKSMDSSYYISLQLVLLNINGELIKIELFKSDEFSASAGYAELNKEFYIQGSEIFNTLDPYIEYIETAQKLNLAVSLVKSDNSVEKPIRNLGQNDIALNSPNLIYSLNLDPNFNSAGFHQDLNLPEAFSHAENSDITDIGFSLYYR